jgi:methylmalonyl-CoA mutase
VESPVALLDVPPSVVPPYPVELALEPLPSIRLAEPFETRRDASDRMLAQTGARPKIFLANLGKLSDFTARATFARSFFEAGGIEVATNDGFANHDGMIAAFRRSGAKLAYATVREFCGEPGDKHVWTVKAVNGRIEQEAHHI